VAGALIAEANGGEAEQGAGVPVGIDCEKRSAGEGGNRRRYRATDAPSCRRSGRGGRHGRGW
jgi:hypothetical protein